MISVHRAGGDAERLEQEEAKQEWRRPHHGDQQDQDQNRLPLAGSRLGRTVS
jgi:hypothetical protein